MTKTVLITGATDGIGLETARRIAAAGHNVILHGRSDAKLQVAQDSVAASASAEVTTANADLSDLREVAELAERVKRHADSIDVLINNAGVFALPNPKAPSGLDLRFVVNTLAPYLLTQRLLPALASDGRVVNLSSAAQASVDLAAMRGERSLSDNEAYAQSKLAITMWTRHLAAAQRETQRVFVAVNPASFLASKMVKEAYGVAGSDLGIGADILARAALSAEFADASGRYYDNDAKRFADPHPDALDAVKNAEVVSQIEALLPLA